MIKKSLIQLIKKYWNKVTLKKNKYLFKTDDNDFNLYLLDKGSIILEKNNKVITSVSWNEILGEKSFILWKPKDLSCKADKNITVYVLDYNDYHSLDKKIQNNILEWLVVTVSNRVYKLNDILDTISSINSSVINLKKTDNLEKNLKNIFDNIIKINTYLLLKSLDSNDYQKIIWNIPFDDRVDEFLWECKTNSLPIKIGKNYIYIKAKWYIYLLMGDVTNSKYKITNSLFYAMSMLVYFAEKTIQIKTTEENKKIKK